MKHFFLSLYGKIIAATLIVIGIIITACAKYGTPSADFIVKGKVTDKSTQKPINNIAVIRKTHTSPYGNDTVKTNADGEFEMKFTEFPGMNHWIFAEDLDEAENGGLYAPDSLKINSSLMRKVKKGRGDWFEGTFEKNDADFQLKHQTDAMYGVLSAEYKKIDKDE